MSPESKKCDRREFFRLSILAGTGAAVSFYFGTRTPDVNAVMLASSSGVRLQEYLANPFLAPFLFPGLNLTIVAESGKTIDWQREQIENKNWLADCSPFPLVILNLALNDLLKCRSARDIFQKDFVPAYDAVHQRCNGRIAVLGAFPVKERSEDDFVTNQKTFNGMVTGYARQLGGLGLDPFTALANERGIIKKGYMDDDRHPNFWAWLEMSRVFTPQLLSFVKA